MAFQKSKSLEVLPAIAGSFFMSPFQQHQAMFIMSELDGSPGKKKLFSSLDRHLDMIQKF